MLVASMIAGTEAGGGVSGMSRLTAQHRAACRLGAHFRCWDPETLQTEGAARLFHSWAVHFSGSLLQRHFAYISTCIGGCRNVVFYAVVLGGGLLCEVYLSLVPDAVDSSCGWCAIGLDMWELHDAGATVISL
jgi:hypothetical protein